MSSRMRRTSDHRPEKLPPVVPSRARGPKQSPEMTYWPLNGQQRKGDGDSDAGPPSRVCPDFAVLLDRPPLGPAGSRASHGTVAGSEYLRGSRRVVNSLQVCPGGLNEPGLAKRSHRVQPPRSGYALTALGPWL